MRVDGAGNAGGGRGQAADGEGERPENVPLASPPERRQGETGRRRRGGLVVGCAGAGRDKAPPKTCLRHAETATRRGPRSAALDVDAPCRAEPPLSPPPEAAAAAPLRLQADGASF